MTASGEQHARSELGPAGIEPEPQGDADRVRGGAEERDRAVDPAAHRYRDASRRGRRGEHGRDRVRERIGGERLAGHGRRLEQREAGQRLLETRRVRLDDDVVLDDQPNGGVVLAARGVADQFEQRHAVRLAADSIISRPLVSTVKQHRS